MVNDVKYDAAFGPNGSIQRAKQDFIASRFHPRKPLDFGGSKIVRRDKATSPSAPANVCAINDPADTSLAA